MENYRNFNFEKPTQIQKSTQTSQPNKINGNNNKVNKNKNETKNNNVVGAQKDNTNTNNNKGGSREIGSQNNEPLGDRINQMSKVNQNSPTAVVNNAVAATAIGNYDNNYGNFIYLIYIMILVDIKLILFLYIFIINIQL